MNLATRMFGQPGLYTLRCNVRVGQKKNEKEGWQPEGFHNDVQYDRC